MKDKYKNIKNKSQPGNVLIYSLLVIAAILSTTVVISNFLQTSIKQSQTIVNAQKAFYAADSGVEKLLYTIRKQEILPDFEDCSVPLSCRWEKSDKLVLERRLDLEKNKSTQIDVFNPENNDMGTKLESIGLDWQGTNTWLELSLIKWPAEQSFSWNSWQFGDEQEDLVVQKFLYNGESATCNYPAASLYNYKIRIKALYGSAEDLKVTLYPIDDRGGQQLAFKNMLTYSVIGSSQGANHLIKISLPRFSPLLGMFDYVLFSEDKIIK